MKLATILVSLFPMMVARHHHRTLLASILKPSGNFYTDLNQEVQNVVNGLFDALNLRTTFHNKTRVKLLLTMHYDLKTMVERNYDVYEKMKQTAIPDNLPNVTDKIDSIINDLLDDKEILKTTEGPVQTTLEYKHTKFKTENITTPIFRDSKEFDEFIKDFIEKVDKLSLKDFYNGPGLSEDPVMPKPPVFEEDINVWEPPAVIELDFVNDTKSRRIYRGKKTRIKKFPFMASVHILGTFACAGSVISRDLILTAASCLQLLYNNRFYRENPRAVFVRLGSDFYAGGGERIEIIETYFHPSYDPKTLKNNLVILRMQKLLKFMQKQKRVKRILFDRSPEHLPANTNGILIIGWGARKQSHIVEQFQRLMVAQLDFYHIEECANIYSKHYVTNLNFCAGFISTGGGACNKDVGGPGIVAGVLMGVVSFGAPVCGTVDAPTVFTKLGHYARWIDSIIELRPPVVGVRTTANTRINKEVSPTRTYTRPSITPITAVATYRAHDKSPDLVIIKDVLQELSKFNNSVIKDILYSDVTDKADVAKTSPIDPSVNKSMLVSEQTETLDAEASATTTTTVTETTTEETSPSTVATIVYSKPNLMMTKIYTIPVLPSIPDSFYESDENYVTAVHEVKKIDPKYYDSYEYRYERTPKGASVTEPQNKLMFLRQSLKDTYVSTTPYQSIPPPEQHVDNYGEVTPVNKLKITRDRYEDYYEAKAQT